MITNKKILFCNIAWMDHYEGISDDDKPQFGGSYVVETGRANEEYNFWPIEINNSLSYLGSFETKHTSGKNNNTCHIEKIRECSHMKDEEYAEDILVVWCAKHSSGSTRVVGWYVNARVYRNYQSMDLFIENEFVGERTYNITALTKDCTLLPANDRKFRVPRKVGKYKIPHGFGSSNVWYASEETANNFVNDVIKYIQDYNGDNWAYMGIEEIDQA